MENKQAAMNVDYSAAELAALMQQYARAKAERKRKRWAAIRAIVGLPFAIALLVIAVAVMIAAAPFFLVSAVAGQIAASIKWLALWCVGGHDSNAN